MGSLAEEAFTVLREVCEDLGIDHRDAELLRVRSNAVFKLRSEIVVRIATAPNALTRLPLVLAVARWLAEQGFPAVRPADEISEQPVVHEGRVVTFWHYVPPAAAPPPRNWVRSCAACTCCRCRRWLCGVSSTRCARCAAL